MNGEQERQLVLPKYRQIALRGLHDDMFHQGRDRTYWLVQQRFRWPNMYRDVQEKWSIVNGAYGVNRGRNQGLNWLLYRHLGRWNFCALIFCVRKIKRWVRNYRPLF